MLVREIWLKNKLKMAVFPSIHNNKFFHSISKEIRTIKIKG